MSPAYKYTLGRLGLFAAVFAALTPVPLNILVRAMIALFASAGLGYFLLAKWRNEMAEVLGAAQARRAAEKRRLRAALSGDEEAAAAGDRAGPAIPPSDVAAAKDLPAEDRVGDDRAAEPAKDDQK